MSVELVGMRAKLPPGERFPLVVEAADERPAMRSTAALCDFLLRERARVEEALLENGAVLLRGFDVHEPEQCEAIARAASGVLLRYIEGSSERIRLTDWIYTSTEYPAALPVTQHSELSYAHRWPHKLFFFCLEAPQSGGETPLADTRQIYARIDPRVRERFEEKGVRYVRNLRSGNGAPGLGLPWQHVFETEDPAEVEAYCREGSIDLRWNADGSLWTSQVRAATATHPRTGDVLWFNQADQFHLSNLGAASYRALLSLVGEQGLPIHALYGDATPLDDAALAAVRAALGTDAVLLPWRNGDVLLADNMLIAHGRMPYRGRRRVLAALAD